MDTYGIVSVIGLTGVVLLAFHALMEGHKRRR
jgi:hypothetical protein